MLSLYRALIQLRRGNEVLTSGELRLLPPSEHILAYQRRLGGETLTVLLNLGDQACGYRPESPAPEVLLSSHLDRVGPTEIGEVPLRANEGVILRSI